MKHFVGAMIGARANVCNSTTRQFTMQIGQKVEEANHKERAAAKMKRKKTEDKMKACNDKEERVFSSILGKCNDTGFARLKNTK